MEDRAIGLSSDDPDAAASAIARMAAAASREAESARSLPPALVAAIADAGLFRLCVPRSVGGLESDAVTVLRVIETVSAGDGSAGWCVMIGATSGLVAGFMPKQDAREIFGSPSAIAGGVFAPRGRADAIDGGYRVSGRWPFASGSGHCTWLMGGCVVSSGGDPVLLRTGGPDPRMMLFPVSEARIHDTWHVAGLRGTGSNDMEVQDIFVPSGRSVSLVTDVPLETGPLYVFPTFGLLAVGIAAVALGIARGAIDDLIELAGSKRPAGSRKVLTERAAIQADVARAEAAVRSARSWLYDAVGAAWEQAASAGSIEVAARAALRLAATHATSSAARAVDLMYEAGGGSSIYEDSPLQRRFRDVHVATQHMMVSASTLELTGRILCGLPTDTEML